MDILREELIAFFNKAVEIQNLRMNLELKCSLDKDILNISNGINVANINLELIQNSILENQNNGFNKMDNWLQQLLVRTFGSKGLKITNARKLLH